MQIFDRLFAWLAKLTEQTSPTSLAQARSKHFRLSADQIKPIAEGFGGCLATDRITIEGAAVGYMYREPPDHELDSGWRFFAGDESDAYLALVANLGVYDVNTIANYDPSITPHLTERAGNAFKRVGNRFEREALKVRE